VADGVFVVTLVLAFLLPRLMLPYWDALASKFFLGWIAVLFLLTAVASVLWVVRSDCFAVAFFGYAVLVDSAAIVLLMIGLSTRFLGWGDVLRLYSLLVTWVAVWAALAYLLRRRPPIAAMVAMMLVAIFFASPIAGLPLVRAASRCSPSCRENTLQFVAYATPVLPAFDAVKGSLPAGQWPEWTMMYRMSNMSQELGLRARWYWAVVGYAGVAIAVLAGRALAYRLAAKQSIVLE